MGKLKEPTTLADHLGIPAERFEEMGVLNPTLGIDVRLFIDPLLLSKSAHPEIRNLAAAQYRKHFTQVIKLLAASREVEDVAWRSARKLLEFHELKATCLGYGDGSISGSAFGKRLTGTLLRTAKQIADLGINDPDLFSAMALLEEKIGPDRISDMTTNVILEPLLRFNARVLKILQVKGESFDLGKPAFLIRNPCQLKRTPVLLVPRDVLRPLPTALDWDSVCTAAAHNAELRRRVNKHLGQIWEARTREEKKQLRLQALASKEAFQTILDAIHGLRLHPYDLAQDPKGLVRWVDNAREITAQFPLSLPRTRVKSVDEIFAVVKEIVKQFRQLIERRGLAKNLWYRKKSLPERYAQMLFFAIAYGYCKDNNLDIIPEADTGTGKVDFKISSGFKSRVLVETKLSTNTRTVSGYETQLETYKTSEETIRAIYLVIDVGSMGRKAERLIKIRNKARKQGNPLSELEFIDGRLKPSASEA